MSPWLCIYRIVIFTLGNSNTPSGAKNIVSESVLLFLGDKIAPGFWAWLCILTHLMTLCDQQPSPKFHVTAAAASDVSNAKTRTRKEDGRRQAAGQLPVRVIAAQPECGRHGADCLIKLVKMNRAPHSNWRNVANTIHMFLQNMTHKCN